MRPNLLPSVARLVLPVALQGALWASLGLTAACDNDVDTSKNKLPSALVAADVQEAPDVSTQGCDCLQPGKVFRFDVLALDTLDGGEHPVISQLNKLWQLDIDKHELNFYFVVQEVSATQVKIRVVNGARLSPTCGKNGCEPGESKKQKLCAADCAIDTCGNRKCEAPTETAENCAADCTTPQTCVLPATEAILTFPRKGCTLDLSSPGSINVFAGTRDNPKNCSMDLAPTHSIPVRDALLKLKVSETCDTLSDGVVSQAVISKEALSATCTCLTFDEASPAESCGTLDPKYAMAADTECPGCCKGCNNSYQNLDVLLSALGGGPLQYACKTADGKAATCLSAHFSAKAIAALPGDCVTPTGN